MKKLLSQIVVVGLVMFGLNASAATYLFSTNNAPIGQSSLVATNRGGVGVLTSFTFLNTNANTLAVVRIYDSPLASNQFVLGAYTNVTALSGTQTNIYTNSDLTLYTNTYSVVSNRLASVAQTTNSYPLLYTGVVPTNNGTLSWTGSLPFYNGVTISNTATVQVSGSYTK